MASLVRLNLPVRRLSVAKLGAQIEALVAIFGEPETNRITAHFDQGGGDIEAEIHPVQFHRLQGKRASFRGILHPEEQEPT
jgi:hypothetical protein